MGEYASVSSVAIAALACYVIYKHIIYPVFLSPLSQIPSAHPSCCISPFWILYKRHSHQENRSIHAAHLKHGPIVRLGPNEISVNCVEGGIKTVYAGGFEKHKWYPNLFQNYGVINMFSMDENRPHSVRKRMLSNVFSKSYLQSSPTMAAVSERVVHERLLPRLDAVAAGEGQTDAFVVFQCASMDIVTGYKFGLCNSTNFLQQDATAAEWLELYGSRKKYTFWPQELPGVSNALASIGIRLSPAWVADANQKLEASCLDMCDAAEKQLVADGADEAASEDVPLVYRQLKSALLGGASKANTAMAAPRLRLTLASELLDNLAAGFETSAITLTYLFHELASRPLLQAVLRDELSALSPPLYTESNPSSNPMRRALPSAKSIDALPLLHSTIMETLRVHSAIPGPQPRITPRQGTTLAGVPNIPPKVRVSAQPYSLHRIADVFPSPESWQPERWLTGDDRDRIAQPTADSTPAAPKTTQPTTQSSADDDDGMEQERLRAMHRHFWAFGSGGRMCIGSNLAMQQMKLVAAAILANYAVAVGAWPDGTPGDAGIEQEDAYTARLVGKGLMLRFARVDGPSESSA